MSITIQWDDQEKTAIRWEFEGTWDWSQYYQAQQEHLALVETVPHVVHSIIDLHRSSTIPGGAPSQFRRAIKPHPRTGLIVITGANRFVEIMLNMYTRFQRENARKMLVADSVEQARALLAERTTPNRE